MEKITKTIYVKNRINKLFDFIMKKILIIFIFFLSQCGFQPIYLNKNKT